MTRYDARVIVLDARRRAWGTPGFGILYTVLLYLDCPEDHRLHHAKYGSEVDERFPEERV